MLCSTFAGLLVFAIPQAGQALSPAGANGDIFIGQDFETATWEFKGLNNIDGNLTIRAGGTVIVTDGALNFLSSQGIYNGVSFSRVHTLIIEDGGQLILRNSTLMAEDVLFNVTYTYALGVLIRNGGSLVAEDSYLTFSGKILVDDATFIANGTTIDGPLFTAMSSDVEIFDSVMTNVPGTPTLVEMSYPYSFATSYNHTTTVDYSFQRNPDAARTVVPAGQVASNLTMSDSRYVTLATGNSMVISGFDIGGLVFDEGQALSVQLKAEYRTADLFNDASPDHFYYFEYLDPTPDVASSMSVTKTYQDYNASVTNQDMIITQDLSGLALSSLDLSVLNVTLTNNKLQNIFIDRVWVEVGLAIPAYNNITMAGTSEFTAVNSMLGVNYLNYSMPEYRKLAVTDLAQANLYGVQVDGEFEDSNSTGPFVTVQKSLTFKPLAQGNDDTTTESNVVDLLTSNNQYYTATSGETLHVQSFNIAGYAGDISSAVLSVEYLCNVGYVTPQFVQWNVTGTPLTNANLLIQSTTEETITYQLPSTIVTNLDQLSLINIEFNNPDAQLVAFDDIKIITQFDPTINVYRWANVRVLDSNNEPVSGAYVNATGSRTNQPAMYSQDNTWSALPSQSILDYLDKGSSNFTLTNDLGLVVLPLLTDTVNDAWAPNSFSSENYEIAVAYTSDRGVLYTPQVQYTAFDAYPDLGVQSSDIEIIILDLQQENSGDWIVTSTQSFAWSSLNWQYNIIVEGNGRLTIQGTALFMDQTANPSTIQIIVRDNGTLILNNSSISSDSTLGMYLFDNGRLFVNGSILQSNVNLIMDGSSTIFMENSRVRGQMSAPDTSSVTLETFNTTFDYPLADFGGNSVARLTASNINGESPVSPKDNAIIYLYGWIVVQVYDGTGHTLAEVKVQAKTFSSGVVYANGVTDNDGILLIQGLSAVVTKAGPQLSGSYLLNATYLFEGSRYDYNESDPNLAQVQYDMTKPMLRSDAYVPLNISGAKPDIDPPFTASVNETYRGGNVTLSAVISNVGVVTGYDVLVRFEDNSSAGKVIIQDYVIDEIAPLSNVTVNITWVADYPLSNHTLSVTVDPLNEIPELNEDNNFNSTPVKVLGVPDPTITAADITVGSNEPARDRATTITAVITNLGDYTTAPFNVSFVDSIDGVNINITKKSIQIPAGQNYPIVTPWTPTVAGIHTITVTVDSNGDITEGNENNNVASIAVKVNDYPDLIAVGVGFLINGVAGDQAYANDDITIDATVFNNGESAALNFTVEFRLNNETTISMVNVASLASMSTKSVTIPWVPTINVGLGQFQNVTIVAVVNPNKNVSEINYGNNQASQELLLIDNRPDLAIIDPTVRSVGVDVTGGVLGEVINIAFDANNIGIVDASNVKIKIYLDAAEDIVLYENTVNIAKGGSVPVNVSWTINVHSGTYNMVMDIDAGSDANITNNKYVVSFVVAVPTPAISIDLGGKTDYAPGDAIIVNGRVLKDVNGAPLVGQSVKVSLTDQDGFTLTTVFELTTDTGGWFYTYIQAPADTEGTQRVSATLVTAEGNFTKDVNINIVAPLAPESIPLWVYLLIIVIVIAVIAIFSMYLYKVGLGRMVECGNCGALIPEASKHCPKCGVEFEAGTAKCSECGAWIPSKAESCPDCGAKFMTEPVDQGQTTGYVEAMRKRYDEYVDGFRTQAKTALGNKYSEEKFLEWLQTEPNYLPFEEWLRKEEMSKRTGIFPCPSCGTLNPRESTVCHRCGTVFEEKAPVEQAKPEEKKSPFRRIVRRSEEGKEKEQVKPSEPTTEVKEEVEKKDE